MTKEIIFNEDMFAEELKFELEQTDTICSDEILNELNNMEDNILLNVIKKMGGIVKIIKISKITEDNVLKV